MSAAVGTSFPQAPLDRSWLVTQEPAADFVSVTPDVASMWLDLNLVNRRRQSSTVEQYRADMLNGHWRLTGESIKFARGTGNLLDGQHRLLGVARGGAPLDVLVIRGLDPEVQKYLDQGKARTTAQRFALNGWKNNQAMAAIALQMLRCEQVIQEGRYSGFVPISQPQQEEWILRNPDVWVVCERWNTKQSARPVMVNKTVWPVVALMLTRKSPAEAEGYLSGLASGADLPTGSPILAARATLGRLSQPDRNRLRIAQIALLLHTWETWRAGKSVRWLKFDDAPDVEKLRRLLSRNYVNPSDSGARKAA